MKQIEIAERQVWVQQTAERPEWVIIQPVDDHGLHFKIKFTELLFHRTHVIYITFLFLILLLDVQMCNRVSDPVSHRFCHTLLPGSF